MVNNNTGVSPRNVTLAQGIRKAGANDRFKVHFEENVQTKQLVKTRLSTIEADNVEVIVDEGKMEKAKGFFASGHFLSYKVSLRILNCEVRRKDEDFDDLQKYLNITYPNIIVPGKKPHKADRYNEQKYITKRATVLSRFVRDILRSRVLRGDSYLMSFLTETEDKRYNKDHQNMLKALKVTRIDDIIT